MSTRRKFLKVLGGGIILSAAGAAAWATTRDPSIARAPWSLAGQEQADVRRWALSYAILAPNPHNRQPWLVDLAVEDEILLYCEESRRLDHTDPFDRQITIGLGGFLELMMMALAEKGVATELILFPDGEPQPRLDKRLIARVKLTKNPAGTPDPLFAYVLQRRTNRIPYDTTRAVEETLLTELSSNSRKTTIAFTQAPEKVVQLRDIAWRGMDTEFRNPETMLESADLMRVGKQQINDNPDGISMAGPMLEALSAVGLFQKQELLNPESTSFRQQMDFLKVSFDSAMAFMWIVTPGNSRFDQIEAGREYVRLNLAATKAGLSMQPWSQALQEFDAMKELYAEMRLTLDIEPQQGLQMFVRAGYAEAQRPSPRWPAETRILKS